MCPCGQDPCNCTPVDNTTPLQIDAASVFYHKDGCTPSRFTCLGVTNGTPLDVILELFDTKLCQNSTNNYIPYRLSCLRARYIIQTNQQFAEAVDAELCTLRTLIGQSGNAAANSISNLTDLVTNLNLPRLSDPCQIGFNESSTMREVIQAIILDTCRRNAINPDTSPSIAATPTASIGWVLGGIKNHTLQASVKISATAGNRLTLNNDGLFVGPVAVPNQIQQLQFDPVTRALSVTQSSDSVILPQDSVQTIAFNCSTKRLTLSNGGGTVDLTCLTPPTFSETPITNTPDNSTVVTISGTNSHNIKVVARVSTDVNNALVARSTGLYVPTYVEVANTKLDTPTATVTLTGSFGRQIQVNVPISPDADNVLAVTGNGLKVAANTTVYSVNNGLGNTGTLFQLGGVLVKHTRVGDPTSTTSLYDFGVKARRTYFTDAPDSQVGDNNTALDGIKVILNYTQNLKTGGNTGLFNLYNLHIDGTSLLSGRVISSVENILIANIDAPQFIAASDIATASFNNLHLISNSNSGITMETASDGERPISALLGMVHFDNALNATTGVINDVAAVRSLGPYYDPAGTHYVNVTNYYGVHVGDTKAFGNTNITNRYGVYQLGPTDINYFAGPVGVKTKVPTSDFSVNGTADKVGGGSWGTFSDERIKKDIRPFTDGLGILVQVNPVYYKYNGANGIKDTDKEYVGVIAQQVEHVMPYTVEQKKTKEFDDLRIYNPDAMIYMLINSVKELNEKVNQLQSQISQNSGQ